MSNIRRTHLFLFSLLWMAQGATAMWDGKDDEINFPQSSTSIPSKKVNLKGPEEEIKKENCPVTPLFSTSVPIKPGIYESDNIEVVLSHFLKELGKDDIVIFDVDEVLITGLDSYYFEHFSKKTSLHEKLFSRGQDIIDKFFLYMFLLKPWTLMEENSPEVIKMLQREKVKCIANTALNPTINPELNIDVPSLRVRTLRSFGIDFSEAFPDLPSWDFNTLDLQHIPKNTPLFKEGVILSSETPKYISTLEFFKKTGIKPGKILYIDDFLENSQKMHEGLSSLGFECYSVFYSKKSSKPLRSYFSQETFDQQLKKLEFFIEKLLDDGEVDELFRQIFHELSS